MTQAAVLDSDNGLPEHVQGAADPRFSCAVQTFASLFPGPRFGGGALAVYVDGRTGRGCVDRLVGSPR